MWTEFHGWLHIASDLAIFAAYVTIPLVLGYFVIRRKDVPFSSLYLLFGGFILFCGIGHLLEAIIFWTPIYRVAGVVKFGTALVSWGTVVALVAVVPRVLRLPSLELVNEDLQTEIAQRSAAEAALQHRSRSLQDLNEELDAYNRSMLGREERIMELKREVNDLLEAQGRSQRYSGIVESQ